MCGIAGLVAPSVKVDFSSFMAGASRLLKHRGPDDEGYLLYSRQSVRCGRDLPGDGLPGEAALVHRRLSILDLTDAGWQPMSTPDGRYWIVFNGEVYNYLELRAELESLGVTFRSRCDTEVLLAAYARWGAACLPRLVGMFAFAILDTQLRRIFLARDFFGIKPLYYTLRGGKLLFASELKVLLEFSGIRARANPEPLYIYMRYGSSDAGDQTFFQDIQQLAPAHCLELSIDDLRPVPQTRYWDVDLDQMLDLSYEDAVKQVRDLWLENMRLHLRSDVPVGTALSGGIDSSAIVMSMRHLVGSGLDLHTFSYVAEDPVHGEEKWVDVVTEASRSVVHKVRTSPEELVRDLEHLVSVQDVPFGSTRIYAQYRVFRLAHEAGIKVMLDGQGADEILAGYRPYMAARLCSLIRQLRWWRAKRFLNQAATWPEVSRKWLLCWTGEYLLPRGLQGLARRAIGKDLVPAWMNGEWFRERGAEPKVLNYSRARNVMRAHLYRSTFAQNLQHLLRYEDRNSMAFSIESRVPFLTPKFVQFLFSLPEDYILSDDGRSKAVFRDAMRGLVPDAILDRRDKVGFVTPECAWLSAMEPWVQRTLHGEVAQSIPVLNLDAAQREWERYKVSGDNLSMRVWRWLNLIEWTRRFDVAYD